MIRCPQLYLAVCWLLHTVNCTHLGCLMSRALPTLSGVTAVSLHSPEALFD